jgi:hypothetical protein
MLYGISNGPSNLYRLLKDITSGIWKQDPAWTVSTNTLSGGNMPGKMLGFTNALSGKSGTVVTGGKAATEPDTEDFTFDDMGNIFVVIERDNIDKKTRYPHILYYNPNDATTFPSATIGQWDLSASLPMYSDANKGPEAVAWIPDSFLVANKFYDGTAKKTYDPADYPNHGNGLVCLGLEFNGHIYCYAVDKTQNNIFTLISHWFGGNYYTVQTDTKTGTIQALHFDESTGYLYAACDNSCKGSIMVHQINNSTGKFTVIEKLGGPSSMETYNNEGFTIAAECVGSSHLVIWSDDSNTDGNSIREDTVPCGRYCSDLISPPASCKNAAFTAVVNQVKKRS